MSEAKADTAPPGFLRSNWRTLLLAVVAVLGVLVIAALVQTETSANRAREDAIRWQSHTYEVMIRAHGMASTLAGAEAALGRYVISGEKELGRQFTDQWQQAGSQIDRLLALTRDNSGQRTNLERLRRAYDERGAELREIALYSNFEKNSAALGRYYEVRESNARRQLDATLHRVIEHERRLLVHRTEAAARSRAEAITASRFLIAFGVLIGIAALLLGILTVQAYGRSAAADAEATIERERADELEAAVAAATEALREEAAEREATEARLRQAQKMEAVGQLTGGIAHDFNNMLAVVLGGLELARRHLLQGGPEAQRHIENAMEGANRAAALTRRLLAFSRAEPLLPEAIEGGRLLAGMTELIDRTLGDSIQVRTEDAGLGWTLWVDRHALENAILNLAVNARDAMDGRGTLTLISGGVTLPAGAIGECEAGDYVTLAVRDTGCGMTQEVLERVFEPFFTTKPVGKGTGLGLSQIFGFVRQSGGEIGIDTAPGAGTTVTLYLPRHTAAASEPAAELPADFEPRDDAKLRILVVEDDPRVLTATLDALIELGHAPTGCPDPLKVDAALAGMAGIDLILSDVLMPNRTGPEMVALLKPRLPEVAVLFVTGFAGEAEAELFGGYPVLRKPFTLAGLARAIDGAVQGNRAEPMPRSVAAG